MGLSKPTHYMNGTISSRSRGRWSSFLCYPEASHLIIFLPRYKSLSAEEAEQEFGRRKKIMNYFSLMLRKRLKGDEEEEQDPEEAKAKGAAKKSKELKISDMDEWIESEDDSDGSDEEKEKKEEDSDDDSKKKKGKKNAPEKKKKREVDDEAFEESDDGDEEGRELDYISDSSEEYGLDVSCAELQLLIPPNPILESQIQRQKSTKSLRQLLRRMHFGSS